MEATLSFEVPEDIIFAVFKQLYNGEDFSTLFACATSSKRMAQIACGFIYRIYGQSGVNEEENEVLEGDTKVQRWSIMWRSIILSAKGGTVLPYYQFLRDLNLRDLYSLLEDPKFTGAIERNFFSGPLKDLKKTAKHFNRTRLDVKAVTESVGELLVPMSPMIEHLSGGQCSAAALQRWIPKLPRLQSLALWDGTVLASEDFRDIVATGCPKFKSLTMYTWPDPESDTHLAAFISKLPPQSLETLITYSRCGVGIGTCTALTRHERSLRDLRLVFDGAGIDGLQVMNGVTAIEKLELTVPSTVDLKQSQEELFTLMLTWIGCCSALKEVTLNECINGPELLVPLLLNPEVQLDELTFNAQRALYSMKDNREFHQALSKQTSLRSLILKGDGDECVRDDVDTLVDSLSCLQDLRRLKLYGVSEFFSNGAINRILRSLPKLEELFIGGYGVTDAVLPEAAKLPNLRIMNFAALTRFTKKGLLSFISQLQQSNDGLLLAIDNADPDYMISEEDQTLVRTALLDKVRGRFEYILWRDPDVSEFEGESD